jgi:hypothetical protein
LSFLNHDIRALDIQCPQLWRKRVDCSRQIFTGEP